jgi:hypothetical protein
MTEPDTPERQQDRTNQNQLSRAPFDTSDLNNIPHPTDDDPPYQSWWVVTDPDNR